MPSTLTGWAFVFFGGVPIRGIYDNMKTAVDAVFVGKARAFNRRFLLMTDHYMFEPTACTLAHALEAERPAGGRSWPRPTASTKPSTRSAGPA